MGSICLRAVCKFSWLMFLIKLLFPLPLLPLGFRTEAIHATRRAAGTRPSQLVALHPIRSLAIRLPRLLMDDMAAVNNTDG
ncbi:hypothetical protein BGW80DRAFT_394867 [Lactifluus volemus]|nr:hypothetical protein BGW80DRAFT_394867 [Lactifluus volemus]